MDSKGNWLKRLWRGRRAKPVTFVPPPDRLEDPEHIRHIDPKDVRAKPAKPTRRQPWFMPRAKTVRQSLAPEAQGVSEDPREVANNVSNRDSGGDAGETQQAGGKQNGVAGGAEGSAPVPTQGGQPAGTAEAASAEEQSETSQSRSSIRAHNTASATGAVVAWRAVVWRYMWIVAVFSLFINLLMLTVPIYLFQISDRVLTSRSVDTLIMLTLMAVGFLAVLALLDVSRRALLGRISTQFETLLAGPVLASAVSYSQKRDKGIATLRSLHQVRNFIAGPVMLMLFDAPMAPLYFAAVFLIHPDLGFLSVGAGVLLLLTALLNLWLTRKPIGEGSQHGVKADEQADAMARNGQVINAMGMLNEVILQWGREQARALTFQTAAQDRNFCVSGLSKYIRLVTQIAMLGWGAHLALQGSITGGMMIAASIIAGRALAPIEGMIDGWRSVVHARTSYKKILSVADAIQREPARLLLPKPEGRINVDKVLHLPPGGKEPILNGITFNLDPGDCLAIVGPSGSGKSTLAKILTGCLIPVAGRVRLDGTDLRNWDRRQFGEYTGYVPQEVELFPGSIKANISRMREDLPDSYVFDATAMCDVHDIISHLPEGYETIIDGRGSPLSGGQRQRIALARAFFGMPRFVVLDEPNANLDFAGEEALANTLRRAKEQGITVIVVTQRPSLLQCVDKVLVLRSGRMEAFGPPSQVLHAVVPQRVAAEVQSAQAQQQQGQG